MPSDDLPKRIDALEHKLDAVYTSVEKTRKYFLWLLIISVAVIVLPMIGLMFVLPSFLSYYGSLGTLGGVY